MTLSTRLLDFVNQVHTEENVWVFPFETAKEIVETLRMQLAHLLGDALRLRLRLGIGPFPAHLKQLAPSALRIALERPAGWEYLLFFQIWIDEVNNRSDLLRQYDEGVSLGVSEEVAVGSVGSWLQTRLHELTNLSTSLNNLVNTSSEETFGKLGEAGDVERIVWRSRTIGQLFEDALQWALRVRRTRVEPPFDVVVKELARFPEHMLEQLREFPENALPRLRRLIDDSTAGTAQKLELTLTLNLSNKEAFDLVLDDAKRSYFESLPNSPARGI